MTNNELMIAVRAGILNRLQAYGHGYAVEQTYQPHQLGTNREPTIYIHHIGDTPAGWPVRREYWDKENEQQVREEKQVMLTRVQVAATVNSDMTDPNALTVIDVMRIARWCVQSVEFREEVSKQGLSLMRVAEMPSQDVLSDSPGYEKRPTFDIIFQHTDTIRAIIPGVSKIEIRRISV